VSNPNDSKSSELLKITNLSANYGAGAVLSTINLTVPNRGITALVGSNGAGKTTLMRSILGYHPVLRGDVIFKNQVVTRWSPSRKVKNGLGYVPQDTPIFPNLTVRENLLMGQAAAPRGQKISIDFALDFFPKLADRITQKAGTMSGGERKMVGIARALLGQPEMLLMDEPTEGVWHGVVDEIGVRLSEYARTHAIFLVEQNLDFVLALSQHVLVIDRGSIVLEGKPDELSANNSLQQYLTL